MAKALSEKTIARRSGPAFHAAPWVRGLVLLQLFAGLLLVSTHQHHGAAVGHSCAVCSAAQTTGTLPTVTTTPAPPPFSVSAVSSVPEPHVPSAFRASFPSRAPPLA